MKNDNEAQIKQSKKKCKLYSSLTPADPIKNRMANIHQNEMPAKSGERPVRRAVKTANVKITIFPPNHSDRVPPSKDVVR